MKKIILFILLLTIGLSLPAFARKPAVEPVMGISIDEEKPVPPSKLDTGFKFDPNQVPNRMPQSVVESSTADKITPFFFVAILLVFPLALWFGVTRNIKIAEHEEQEKQKAKAQEEDQKKAA